MLSRFFRPSVLIVVVFLVYLFSFGNSFVWDDEQFIVRNVFTTSTRYIPSIIMTNTIAGAGEMSNYYRPLATISFLIDRLVWGLRPFGFHVTNTLLHALATALVFVLLFQLGVSKNIAFGTALIFGIHPIQTEAVVYINSRGDSLFAFFLLLSLVSLVVAIKRKVYFLNINSLSFRFHWPLYMFFAIFFFLCSLLSKEIALAGLGLIGLVLLLLGINDSDIDVRSTLQRLQPGIIVFVVCTALTIGYIALRLTVLNFSNTLNFYGQENEYTQSLSLRLVTFAHTIPVYLRLLVVPYPLHMERSIPLRTSLSIVVTILLAVTVLFAALLSLYEYKRRRTVFILFGLGWFSAMLVPVSGIIPINGLMYEHWMYLPIIGFFLIVFRSFELFVPLGTVKKFRRELLTVGGVWCAILVGLTLRQNFIWRAPIPFYTYTLQYAQSSRLYNNLAMAYSDEKNHERAIEYYKKSIDYGDLYPQTHYNLARSYKEIGNYPDSIEEFKKALTLSPNFDLAKTSLVALFIELSAWGEVQPYVDELVVSYPQNIEFLLIQGQAYFMTNQREKAENSWQKALRISNRSPEVVSYILRVKSAK